MSDDDFTWDLVVSGMPLALWGWNGRYRPRHVGDNIEYSLPNHFLFCLPIIAVVIKKDAAGIWRLFYDDPAVNHETGIYKICILSKSPEDRDPATPAGTWSNGIDARFVRSDADV
jgi:hypothetical protein